MTVLSCEECKVRRSVRMEVGGDDETDWKHENINCLVPLYS